MNARVRATTIRFDPEVNDALELAKDTLSMTKNQIVNAAVAQFSQRVLEEQADEIESRLDGLKKYWRDDPDSQAAIAAVIESEGSVVDPAEGRVVPVLSMNSPRTADGELMNLLNG